MTIPPLDLILLLGAIQGLILAGMLWFSRGGNRLANRLLGTLIGFLALMSFAVGVPVNNVYLSHFIDLAPLFNAMPLGPLIYFYTRSVLDPTFRLGKAERRHFYPVVLDWGAPLIGWTFIFGLLLRKFPMQDGPSWGNVMTEYNMYVDIPRWVSMTVYLALAWRWLARKAPERSEGDEEARRNIRWLRQALTGLLLFQAIWLVHLVPYILPGTRSALLDSVGWYPLYIPIAILIYWMGLKGYLHARRHPVEKPSRKTVATTLPPEQVDRTVGQLQNVMQSERLYLDPELTVEKVARTLQLPSKTVSFVLNQHLRKSFNTFVNEYRVEAVKQRLATSASEHLTLTGIAFECGFNSQATFQRVFKQMTGVSPREFAESAPGNTSQIRI